MKGTYFGLPSVVPELQNELQSMCMNAQYTGTYLKVTVHFLQRKREEEKKKGVPEGEHGDGLLGEDRRGIAMGDPLDVGLEVCMGGERDSGREQGLELRGAQVVDAEVAAEPPPKVLAAEVALDDTVERLRLDGARGLGGGLEPFDDVAVARVLCCHRRRALDGHGGRMPTHRGFKLTALLTEEVSRRLHVCLTKTSAWQTNNLRALGTIPGSNRATYIPFSTALALRWYAP